MLSALAVLLTTAAADELDIPHTRYELENGLEVILAEDHDLPIVHVNIWYHVGSKDEVPGKSGFAHLFEHMMFQGSEHLQGEYFEPLQEIGGDLNGTTNYNRTNYYEGVPAEYLPLALWMEADRMGWLLPTLDQAKLTNQIDVVRNERRQRVDNQPYGTAFMTVMENLFPEGHPYHIPTIGRHEDLEAASLEDVHNFFKKWYVPNNATLVICGDFDPETAKKLVEDYFGEIPRGEEPALTTAPPAALAEEVVVRQTEAGVPHQKVWIAWGSPAAFGEGDAELDILASILTNGKSSRLYKELVLDRQIARTVSAYQGSQQLVGYYMIAATAADGHTTDEIVAAVDEIMAEVLKEGVTQDEVSVAITDYEARYIRGLNSIAAKADTLNFYNQYVGDPGYVQEDLNRYLAVTPQGVQEAATKWLTPGRVVLHITPAAEEADAQ